jgi:ubiquinone/menaquinone biosynthesis C-methylase UbiE
MESKIVGYVDSSFVTDIDGVYSAHQPIYGYRTPFAQKGHIARYIIIKSILNNILKYKFDTYIDIGGGEGYLASIVKKQTKAKVKISEIDENAGVIAKKIYDIDYTTDDIRDLPFKNNEFEVVTCSETLEHVDDWEKGLEELIRITDKLLVISVPHDPIETVKFNRENKIIGSHINYFDINSFDFLKNQNIEFTVEKTLSPFLTKIRIIVESYKKEGNNLGYKIYNLFTPIFLKVFGIKSANKIIDLDVKFVKYFKKYNGLTVTIKKGNLKTNEQFLPIEGKDLTSISVPLFRL